MLKIIIAPNSILAEKAKLVPIKSGLVGKIDKNILKLIDQMKQALFAAKDPEGVGLAAPQVGEVLRIFIIKPTTNSRIQTFINPEILSLTDEGKKEDANIVKKERSRKKFTKLEGCLSLPNIWGLVQRKPKLTLSYLNEKGEKHIREFTGLCATIIQHEMDHLNGDLFPKRVLEQKGKLFKSHKDEKNQDVFEEIEL